MHALARAIETAGGAKALAELIGVSSSAPSMWKARGRVPADHCPAIERATGVKCEELRPEVEWSVLRTSPPIAAAESKPQAEEVVHA